MIEVAERKILVPVNGHHRTATLYEIGPEDARATILYIHRFGGGGLEFIEPAKKLVGAGYRVCCLELFGHENSEWLQLGDYSPSHDVSSAKAAIDGYMDRPVLIIGNGWGGHIALQSISQDHKNLVGVNLFDYVNSVQYATDIVMPLEQQITSISTTDLEGFGQKVSLLTRPHGRFGKLALAIAMGRVRRFGDRYTYPVDTAAYAPFQADPMHIYSSGAKLINLSCPVAIINGRLAEFKNLLNPPKHIEAIPENIQTFNSPKLSFLTWKGAKEIDIIIEFLETTLSTTKVEQ